MLNRARTIYLVGIGNQHKPQFSEEILALIQSGYYFSGGKRHYELVNQYLPESSSWISIHGKMENLIDSYRQVQSPLLIFVSGDPFFYGFGNTLQRLMPEAILKAYPYFNSIQRLCHKTQTNYNNLNVVTVHGRPWSALDCALIQDKPLIGVLTDKQKSPQAIAQRLLDYGFTNYSITVGEALDGIDENIGTYTLVECTNKMFDNLNCILLKRLSESEKGFGLADSHFIPLNNRPNMMTKLPVRLMTLHALGLKENQVFWDIGSCTGAVAIETKRQYPTTEIIAFEKRLESKTLIPNNAKRCSAPGIQVVIDDVFNLDLKTYPTPDIVFIGGHGNRLEELLHLLYQINPKARLVTNAVTENTNRIFVEVLTDLGYSLTETAIQVNQHNPITIRTAELKQKK